jgi:hypothetical protein
MGISRAICWEIEKRLKGIPVKWDGKNSILEMKDAGNKQWRQMEWIGFYFKFLCEKYLADLFAFQVPRYGNASFDGLYQFPFDFKAHAINTSSHRIPINDREAIECGIKNYGSVGLIIAVGNVVYNDEDRTFQKWHETLKGKESKYVSENRKRGAWSRLRKFSMILRQISIIEINSKTLEDCGSFQTGFRNSDGSPRREKVLINLEKLGDEIKHCIEY